MFRRTALKANLGRGDEYVRKVFDNVASKYDVMNDVLSLGIHRVWKQHFVDTCVAPKPGKRYLDVAGGTGDIAFKIVDNLRANQNSFKAAAAATQRTSNHALGDVVVFDINPNMLAEGEARSRRNGYHNSGMLQWIEGSGEELPFADNSFDSYTVAFGIRNFNDRPKALREAHRVLRVGGVLNVLEFCPKVSCNLLTIPYEMHSHLFMPIAGKIAGDEEAYQYLVDSIRAFPDQEKFAGLVSDAGFGFVRYQDLSGGIAAIHTGVKTSADAKVAVGEVKPEGATAAPESQ